VVVLRSSSSAIAMQLYWAFLILSAARIQLRKSCQVFAHLPGVAEKVANARLAINGVRGGDSRMSRKVFHTGETDPRLFSLRHVGVARTSPSLPSAGSGSD
jgi:hypothetical protein